ncbi:MAG: substrate-binding domain-containing protein [Oscillospiraceae bacterium]|nr:substrate-binding domain-containing protein [Oscillospiraceae bacterium]
MAIKIAAAASLINGLPQIISAFNGQGGIYEEIEVCVPWYASSGALARRIIGTQFPKIFPDIFIAASEDAMDLVANFSVPNPPPSSLVSNREDIIGNTLVIVKNANAGGLTLAGNSFGAVNSGNAALSGVHIWIANPDAPDYVPAGIYAREAFKLYTPDANHWDYVFGKATSEGTLGSDVQKTLDGVVTDPGPAIGVVYNSDAKNECSVTIIAVADPPINDSIIYPAAQIYRSGQDDGEIEAFLEFLDSPTAQGILLSKGFRELN